MMKSRRVALSFVTALALAGAVFAVVAWRHGPTTGVVSPPDKPRDYSLIGIADPGFDPKSLRDVKTEEDFKNLPGLSFDTAAPSPSPYRS